jgi:hypothetical protein
MSNPEPNTRKRGPADVLIHLIVTFLTPMFLAVAGGDPRIARMAATEALYAYGTKNLADLIAIAQIIALGLAVLDSLGRSMADAVPDRLVLRLRGNATGLNRAAEQCRRTLRSAQPKDATPFWLAADFDPEAERRREDAVIAEVARATQRLAEVTAASAAAPAATPEAAAPAPQPAARPAPAAEPATATTTTAPTVATPVIATPVVAAPATAAPAAEPTAAPAVAAPAVAAPATEPAPRPAAQPMPATAAAPAGTPTKPAAPAAAIQITDAEYRRRAWASAMTDVARECTAELPHLPPAERRVASMRAAALSSVAQHLLSGEPLPPSILDTGRHAPRP